MKKKEKETENLLLIDKMMDENNYFPNCTKFESINKEISDKHNFSKIFNNFLSKLKDFDRVLTENNSSKTKNTTWNKNYEFEYGHYLIDYIKISDDEVKEYIKNIWEKQFDINPNNIRHICSFLILVDKYINRSGKLTNYDKNILYWTILYHDLGKYIQMNPFIDEKINTFEYDKTHPFKSIIIFLNSAFDHELFFYPNDEYKKELNNIYKEEFINAIYNSWIRDKSKLKGLYNINFNHIDIIEKFFMKIKSEEKNEWIYDICILITFHQSLPNNEYHMNSPLLEEKYIKIFFDKRLAEMMRIIMIYDSASHSMFYGSYWPEQINKNMDEVMKLFV
jgi:hypothetical protein